MTTSPFVGLLLMADGCNIAILRASFMCFDTGLRLIEKVNQGSLLEGKTIRRGVLPL
jgi:hypothetical protein